MSPRPKKQWHDLEEIVEVLQSLPRVGIGYNNYTHQDRAKDFMAVFNTEQGRRVLAQISDYCSPVAQRTELNSLGVLSFNEGMRSVFGFIARCMTWREPPKIQRKKEDV